MSLTPIDQEILDLIRHDQREAVTMMVRRYSPLVKAYLVRVVGPDDAEDVTQEVFIRAAAHLDRFRGESGLGWWLARIAARCGTNHLRRHRRRAVSLTQEPDDDRPGPEEQSVQEEDRRLARAAFALLGDPERAILLLREVFGLSYEEVRARLGLSFVGTVRSRLHNAREALRTAWSRVQGRRVSP